jgi:hypothetical protein
MIQISIVKESQITNQASFPTMEEAQAWLSSHEGMGTFGQKKETVERQVLIFPAVIDSEGLEISPAQFEAQMVDLEGYTVEMLDISAQLEQEATNASALRLLAESDWMILRELDSGVACPQEVKDARAAARASIVR